MRLRKLKSKDAPLMLEWMYDKNVTEHLAKDFSKLTLYDCQNFINKSQNDKNNLHLAVVNDTDEYQGTVSLKNIDYEHKKAEFAIAIRSCAMGKGFGRFAMQEIIKIGLEKLKLQEIYWNVKKDNERAITMYDNLGFTKTLKIPEKIGGGYKTCSGTRRRHSFYLFMLLCHQERVGGIR
ncbi:MAG: GNAT family N-acetyltransferase [Phascolarctobacterium sp.]|nr:GNAT family N-acetyltransferase [Candidatus Phascolarctobacterium caballi]